MVNVYMETGDTLLIMHCMPKVDPQVYFCLSGCNLNTASSNSSTTLCGHDLQCSCPSAEGCKRGWLCHWPLEESAALLCAR